MNHAIRPFRGLSEYVQIGEPAGDWRSSRLADALGCPIASRQCLDFVPSLDEGLDGCLADVA
jgi:hypothetical protein